jgi:hypothetical protein
VAFSSLGRPQTLNKLAQERYQNSAGKSLLHERAAAICTDENLTFYSRGGEIRSEKFSKRSFNIS